MCTRADMKTRTNTHTHVYTHTHTHTFIHPHTHTHTHADSNRWTRAQEAPVQLHNPNLSADQSVYTGSYVYSPSARLRSSPQLSLCICSLFALHALHSLPLCSYLPPFGFLLLSSLLLSAVFLFTFWSCFWSSPLRCTVYIFIFEGWVDLYWISSLDLKAQVH